MEPPTKKSRPSPGSDVTTSDALSRSERILGELAETMKSMDPPGPSSVGILSTEPLCNFLELKSLQQLVLEKLEGSKKAIEDQFRIQDHEEMKLENLKYQKDLNEHSITVCHDLEKTQLAQLCCDEMNIPVPKTDDGLAEVFQSFLGADPRKPENRVRISSKLNQEVKTKTTLQSALKVIQQQAAALRKNLSAKRKRLHELPSKLKEMERASLPLQKFCQTYLQSSTKLGSERHKMLEMTASLPKPLYTLYYQLQSCLDNVSSFEGIESEDNLPVLEITNNNSTVVLRIHIPTLSDTSPTTNFGSNNSANIHFDYNTKWDMVTAYSSTDSGMGDLIGELFPGDTGEWIPRDEKNGSSDRRRPYIWCNYLAGLQVVPRDRKASEVHISTRVVLKLLVRRVRSLHTLNTLLARLASKPHTIPVHPSMQSILDTDDSKHRARLSSWTEENSTENSRSFVATMTYKSANTSIYVHINPKRYPAIPPKLKIVKASVGATSTLANKVGSASDLFDDQLAEIQRKVNDDVDELVLTAVESSYDWILTHQLAAIANATIK